MTQINIMKWTPEIFVMNLKNTDKEAFETLKNMSESEREYFVNKQVEKKNSSINLLEEKELLSLINKEFEKTIVGEEATRQTLFLVTFGGTLVENAEPTSTNLLVHDDAGAGKDYITEQVLAIIPKERVVKRKRISEKVFTYWHNAKFEPEWTWDGKIFYNEDMPNSVLNSDVFKVFSSTKGEGTATIIINQMAIDIKIIGKPCMIITSASANPNKEQMRRYPNIRLDTTQRQTKEILKRKAKYHQVGASPSYDKKITLALGELKRIKVKVPFAEKLVNALDSRHIIIRTHFDRLIDYCKFSCAIHQYQREIDEEGYYIATGKDYDIARVGILKTTSNAFSIPLTKNQERILEIFKDRKEECLSVSDLETNVSFISERMLRKELDILTEYGFLEKDKQDREESKKPVMVFSFSEFTKIDLPIWKDIQNSSNDSNDSVNANDTIDSNDRTNETLETNEQYIK